jgi:uncharacterized DUF497 family protein
MSDKSLLVWDNWNREHINKHNLTPKEVEEVFESSSINKPIAEPRRLILGKSNAGRYIAIIVAPSSLTHHYYVVTARDMSSKERKYYDSHKTN